MPALCSFARRGGGLHACDCLLNILPHHSAPQCLPLMPWLCALKTLCALNTLCVVIPVHHFGGMAALPL
jgi:hypothetical protein